MENYLHKKFENAMNEMKYKESLKEFVSAHKRNPKDEDLACALGTLLDHEAMRHKFLKRIFLEFKAKRIYQKILKKNPKSICALIGFGRIQWHKNNPKALYFYNQALKIEPNNPVILTSIANVYKSLNDFARAEQYYEKAISTGSASFGTFLNYAKMLAALNKCEQSILVVNKIKQQVLHMPLSENKIVALSVINDIEKKCSA